MTTTPTSGAADLPEALRLADAISKLMCSTEAAARTLAAAADELVRLHALAAGQATAAQQGVAYAALPDEREAFESWLRSVWTAGYGCPKCDSGKYVHGEAQRFWECWQARASHGQAPAQPATVHCKGRNCAAVDGYCHSDECASDHERAASGLDTAGNRNPVARYDGYRGAPCNPAYTKDQQAAWLEGYEARNRQGITPSPQAAQQAVEGGDAEDAARWVWLVDKFGETTLPVMLENSLPSSYIADGKPSIDAAIDAAIKQGKKQ